MRDEQILRSLLLSFLICNSATAAVDDIQVDLGRSIYEKGIGRDGREIGAKLHGGVVLTGASVACAGCHGDDARGKTESFVQVPDIRWANLNKRYTARSAGASAQTYDKNSFARTLRTGISPGGTRLDSVMPRFSLAEDEVESLIDYLSAINVSAEKESQVVILGLLPMPGQNAAADQLAWKIKNCPETPSEKPLAAVDIIYFRDPQDAIAKLGERIRDNPNSIILAPYLAGWEAQYVEATETWGIPTVLPFSFLDPPEGKENSWYYRFPGLQTQIKALLRHASSQGRSKLTIVEDTGNPLSVKLGAFSREVADQYRFQIAKNLDSASDAVHWARLWLTPLVGDSTESTSKTGEMALIPALFFASEKGNELIHKRPDVQWRIAYPYVPQQEKERSWRKPTDVWGKAACEYLKTLGENKREFKSSVTQALQWERDLSLLALPEEWQLLQQVHIGNATQLFLE
jgi:mono/diheme cytochrome c family protein